MANAKSTKKAKKTPKKREPKRKTEKDVLKHSNVVPGSLRFETKGLYANKQTVERVCTDELGLGDSHVFRIATSDLHQKPACGPCTKVKRSAKAAAKRAANRAEKEAQEADAKAA